MRFIKFDIESFYPNITQQLLNKAFQLARQYTDLTKEEEGIIWHSRKSVLIDSDGDIWKKRNNPDFDVTMGSFDGAECCMLVGLLILSKIKTILNCGLFRDDGLGVVKAIGRRGQEVERVRKSLFRIFGDLGLKIVAEGNLVEVDYLDISFNLTDSSFRPFKKPNASIKYVNKLSNHPPQVIKNIPDNINKRLASISCNQDNFDAETQVYQSALDQAGYHHKLQFYDVQPKPQNKKRRRQNILWFNPPFSLSVATNLGKKFFAILNKHFPKGHKFHGLFNKRNVKLSYSCLPSMKALISAHNNKVLNPPAEEDHGCNCRTGPDTCPLKGRCQIPSLVYRAKVSDNTGTSKEYVGQTHITFKKRWNNSKQEQKNPAKENSTELSKHVWKLKRNNIAYDIDWSVAAIAKPYTRETGRCQLCTMERVFIARQDSSGLNRRSEIVNKCIHKKKNVLENWL